MKSRFINGEVSNKIVRLLDLMSDGIPRSPAEMSEIINPSINCTYDSLIMKYLRRLSDDGTFKHQIVKRKKDERAGFIYFMSDEEGKKLYPSLGCTSKQTDGIVYKTLCDLCLNVGRCDNYSRLFKIPSQQP